MSSKPPKQQQQPENVKPKIANGHPVDPRLTPTVSKISEAQKSEATKSAESSRGTKRSHELRPSSQKIARMELRSSAQLDKKGLATPSSTTSPSSIKIGRGDDRPMTPTRLSRLDEKNTLVGLNNRFAAIIDRNNKLENENSKLVAQVHSAEEAVSVTRNNLLATFDKEKHNTRAKLDAAEKDKTKADMALKNAKDQLNETIAALQKKDQENKDLRKQLDGAGVHILKLETELKKQNDENAKLFKENQDLKDKRKQLGDKNLHLEKSVEALTLENVELKSALKNHGEELQLKGQIHEQEVMVLKSTNQSKIAEIGGRLQQEYEARLGDALKQLRADCDDQIKNHKNEREGLYMMKEKDLKKRMESNDQLLRGKDEEIKGLKMEVDEYTKKICTLEGEKFGLEREVLKAKEEAKEDKDKLNSRVRELEERIRILVEEKTKLIEEYQDLMEVKVALDNEIATYRKLLEGEEFRLSMSAENDGKRKQKEMENQVIITTM